MKWLLITAMWALFLFWLYGPSHSTAIIAGAVGLVLIMASVRRDVRRMERR